MLVAENGDRAFALGEDLAHLLEKPPPWIEDLPPGVFRIFAVLADDDHAIDGELLAAERDRALDGVKQAKAVFLRQSPAHVLGANLIDVQRHELEVRPLLAVVVVALDDFADDEVGVRPAVIHRGHRRNLLWLADVDS